MGLFDRFVQRLDWQRPDPRTRLEDLPLLAVDMETTSLDPRRRRDCFDWLGAH